MLQAARWLAGRKQAISGWSRRPQLLGSLLGISSWQQGMHRSRDTTCSSLRTSLAEAPPTYRFELRDYQIEAVDAVLEGFSAGVSRQLVSMPTGETPLPL